MKENDEPAFPTDSAPEGQGFQCGIKLWHFPGMTLRDWFAGQCLRDTFAALADSGWENLSDADLARCATASYKAADAMLIARAKP